MLNSRWSGTLLPLHNFHKGAISIFISVEYNYSGMCGYSKQPGMVTNLNAVTRVLARILVVGTQMLTSWGAVLSLP